MTLATDQLDVAPQTLPSVLGITRQNPDRSASGPVAAPPTVRAIEEAWEQLAGVVQEREDATPADVEVEWLAETRWSDHEVDWAFEQVDFL